MSTTTNSSSSSPVRRHHEANQARAPQSIDAECERACHVLMCRLKPCDHSSILVAYPVAASTCDRKTHSLAGVPLDILNVYRTCKGRAEHDLCTDMNRLRDLRKTIQHLEVADILSLLFSFVSFL